MLNCKFEHPFVINRLSLESHWEGLGILGGVQMTLRCTAICAVTENGGTGTVNSKIVVVNNICNKILFLLSICLLFLVFQNVNALSHYVAVQMFFFTICVGTGTYLFNFFKLLKHFPSTSTKDCRENIISLGI